MNADQIKKLRDSLGLSQEEFARELGVTGRSVSRWETGGAPSRLARRELERVAADLKTKGKKRR